MQLNKALTCVLTAVTAAAPAALAAQELSSDLSTSDNDALRSAIEMRYDAALAATNNDSVIAANDPRYIWASEAKVQCAIALGYLKSDTRDETSISKCDYAYGRMAMVAAPIAPPPPPPAPPPPPVQQSVCNDQQPGLIFFEFDSAVPSDDAAQTIGFLSQNAERCDWDSFEVMGHTDRAGSMVYNEGLSMRRAEAVADLMIGLGIDRSNIDVSAAGETNPRVPTADGIRSPENRRVSVSVTK